MEKIKKIAKNLFKNFFRFLFKLIYGKIIYNKENLKSQTIQISELKSSEIINYFDNKYKVYKIINGRVYTDTVESVAVIDGNNIVDFISYQQIMGNLVSANKNIVLNNGTPRFKKKLKGRVLSLAQGASGHTNYSHWLFDMLPKIKLYSEIYNLNDLNFIYLNNLNSFQFESLKLIGLDHLKVIDSNKFRHIQADEIICTDHPSYYSGYILEQAKNLPIWIVEWLRNNYLDKAEKFECNNKVYIDRSSGAKHCQFINQAEIEGYLKEKGFTKYKLENLSFSNQLYLFKNAKYVVGAHGAGLSNLAFCNKNTNIIEVRPNDHPNTIYKRLSDINKLNYRLISTKKINGDKKKGDINLKVDELKVFLS
jgi:capsular polysaccharide biosynthesis protein